jgi:hypothetical protein
MPSNDAQWDITSDAELQTAVRHETQYDSGKITAPDLEGLIRSAKRVLSLKADVTSFYDDRGIAVALLGITAAKAKGSVENSPVQVKNLGTEDVTFRASDGTSLQLSQYEEMTQLGLTESDTTDAGVQNLRLTNTYFHD